MSLTTPVPRVQDAVFPGENWFFYWKTSASLWKTKLREFPGTTIIVPINWSFHSDTGDKFDFDDVKPETNLKKLVEIAAEVGKKVVFFLPITPAPFLANGGLPHFLARIVSRDKNNMSYGVVDADSHLVKIYSFFDPRVFEGFSKFVGSLGNYFAKNKMSSDLWVVRCGYYEKGEFKTYLEDYSRTFDQAYSRFRTTKVAKEIELSQAEESQLKFEFTKNILSLYSEMTKECLEENFEGTLDIAFLGGGTTAFFKRLCDGAAIHDYTHELYESLAKDKIPSSVLLPFAIKQGVLNKELSDLVINSYLPSRLTSSSSLEDHSTFFEPLSFFKVYEKVDGISSLFQSWNDLGLWPFLKEKFGWSYKIISSDTLNLHESKTPYLENIHLFHGHDVDAPVFKFILKTFMNGGRIILNKSGLADEFIRKIETIVLENNFKVEKVNFETQIESVALGEGRLIMFDGERFLDRQDVDYQRFWQTILSTFSLVHLPIKNADAIDYYWRTRQAGAHELKFEEIRRLSLYNPSSYKKKVKMDLNRSFVVYKVIDEINALVQTFPNELEIELLPEGSVNVDFGVLS